MTWTNELPKERGFYFTRRVGPRGEVHPWRIVEVWGKGPEFYSAVSRGRHMEKTEWREWWSERIPEPAP